MAEIRLLDPVTIGQIAAGEVIERPASVVKELVENAVDAGATRIGVSLRAGGVDSIEVTDDGVGIAASQLARAVQRHATSKLLDAGGLAGVETLGFRGEGLASIAAVSQLELLSRTAAAEIGAVVRAHGERASEVEPAPAPVGTRVRAVDLFAELPVRREFLRSASAEFNRVSTMLSTFALAYPRISFALRHDDKDVWTMPSTDDARERLAMVFGRSASAALIPLTETDRTLGGALRGFVSAPGNDRSDRRLQLLFVNGRAVRSSQISAAWTGGYSTFAMLGRQPYGVLFLELPPESVDANVHPTKSEVRLRYGQQVVDAVRRSIAATLRAHAAQRLSEHAGVVPTPGFAAAGLPAMQPLSLLIEHERAEENGARRMRVLGQIDLTYIAATDGDALLLVDQHAAHERIAYESIVARAGAQAPREPMLVPQVIELDSAQSLALDDVLASLNEAGLEIEPFGERVYRITATPAGYGARPFDLRGFLDDLTEERRERDVRERIWASLACRSVTVAGERLEASEMSTLLARLNECANPMHCPHGRPTMVRLDQTQIARLFKR